MASLNTLRTKYGIVLSIVIALVLVAFILGDQLSYRGGDEVKDEVVLKINGKEVSAKEYYDAGQDVSAVLFQNFFSPELKSVGLGLADELTMRTAYAKYIYDNDIYMFGRDLTEAQVYEVLSATPMSEICNFFAQQTVNNAVVSAYNLNKLDVAQLEAQDNNTYKGRYVAYPYTAEGVEVTDEEVKAYYEALSLRNAEYGARSFIYVEFPHADAAVEEAAEETTEEVAEAAAEVETREQRESRIASFKLAAANDVESFKKAAAEAGLIYQSGNAKMASRSYPLGSMELAEWIYVYKATAGAVRDFVVGDRTYVVMIESVDENTKLPFEDCESALRTMLFNQKVADSVIAAMPADIEEGAEVVDFDITFDSEGYDPQLVGAICSAKSGDVIKVKGDKAAYLVKVDEVIVEDGVAEDNTNMYEDESKSSYVGSVGAAYSNKLDVEYVNPSLDPSRR